jgi:hypothetical protein
MLGGLVRLAEMANPATNAAKAVDPNSPEGYATDVYNYLRETGENTNKLVKNSGTKEITYDKDGRPVVSDTTGSMLEKKSIEIGGDLLRLYTMGAALPGATSILGKVGEGATLFGTQGALETAGAGGTPEQIKKETAKSAAIGGLFGVAAPIGDAVTDVAGTLLNRSIPKIFTEGVTLGTISGGTYGIDKLAGDDNATAIQDAIVNSLFHLGPHIIGKTVELVGKAGQRIVAKVGDDGHVEVAPDNAKPDYTIPLVMGTRTETLKPLNESPASTEVKGHDQGSAPADEQTAGAENTGVKPAIESTPPAGASSPEAPVEPSAEKKQPRIPVAGVKSQTSTVQGVRLDAGTENGATSPNPEATAEAMSDADVTAAAHEAATSPHNDLPEPTEGQIEAGNYKKGHISINGLDISVENPVGSTRSGVDRDGKKWSNTMSAHYGYLKRTTGADSENVDIFIKDGTPGTYDGPVYVVDQVHPDNGKFDEHKALLGFDSEEEARKAYADHYAKGWQGLKDITPMSMDDFKVWAKGGPATEPVAHVFRDRPIVPEANAESLVNERLRAVPDPQNQEERDWNYHVDQIRRYAYLNKVSLGEAEDAYDKSYGGHFKKLQRPATAALAEPPTPPQELDFASTVSKEGVDAPTAEPESDAKQPKAAEKRTKTVADRPDQNPDEIAEPSKKTAPLPKQTYINALGHLKVSRRLDDGKIETTDEGGAKHLIDVDAVRLGAEDLDLERERESIDRELDDITPKLRRVRNREKQEDLIDQQRDALARRQTNIDRSREVQKALQDHPINDYATKFSKGEVGSNAEVQSSTEKPEEKAGTAIDHSPELDNKIRSLFGGRAEAESDKRQNVRASQAVGDLRMSEPSEPEAKPDIPVVRSGEHSAQVFKNEKLTGEVADIQTATIERLQKNTDFLVGAYLKQHPKHINADLAKPLFQQYRDDPLANDSAVHAAASTLARLAFDKQLASLPEGSRVILTAGGQASGKSSVVPFVAGHADLVYDSVMSQKAGNRAVIDKVADAGMSGGIVYVYRNVEDATRAMVNRILDEGRPVSENSMVHGHYMTPKAFTEETDDYARSKGFDVRYYEVGQDRTYVPIDLETLRQKAYDNIADVRKSVRGVIDDELTQNANRHDARTREILLRNAGEVDGQGSRLDSERQGAATETSAQGETPSQADEPQSLKHAEDDTAPIFYSQLERTLKQKMPNRASADQVRGILKDTKKEEREWLGIDQFLDDHNGPISKEDLLNFVRENNVQVQEVVKGGTRPLNLDIEQIRKAIDKHGDFEVTDGETIEVQPNGTFVVASPTLVEGGFHTLEDAVAYVKDLYPDGKVDNTKYGGQYTLPGGENYRELLLTLPTESIKKPYKQWLTEHFTGKDTPDARHAYEEQIEPGTPNYQSRHWDEPNVLAHVRFDDRDGGKTLHIGEIQSDWHQSARDVGYRDGTELVGLDESDKARLGAIENRLKEIRDLPASEYGKEEQDLWAEQARIQAKGRDSRVPSAPFKKSWPLLAVKRMIRFAAENGYDRITWDTGETSTERYNLSKQVDRLKYSLTDGDKFLIVADLPGGGEHEIGTYTREKLPNAIGKELAAKMIEDANAGTQRKAYTGDDLKVGGEGMRGFYDKILPAEVNKYVKPFGAKVEDSAIKADRDKLNVIGPDGEVLLTTSYDSEAHDLARENPGSKVVPAVEDISVHSLTITPAMRDSVMQGQPLFQSPPSATRAAELRKYADIEKFENEHLSQIDPKVEGDTIAPDPISHELMRTARALIAGKDRSQEGLSSGWPLTPNDVQKATEFFKRAGDLAGEQGLQREGFDKIANALSEAAKAKDGHVAWAMPVAVPHEKIHVADARGAMEADGEVKSFEKRYDGATDDLRSDSAFSKFHSALEDLQGPTSHGAAMAESLAWLGTGHHEDFGLTEDEAVNVLATLVNGYARENGVEALSNFDEGTKLYDTINDLRTKSGRGEKGDANGVEGGDQRPTRSAGVEKETAGDGAVDQTDADAPEREQTVSSLKNSIVDNEREKRGMAPVIPVAKREFGEVWNRAMKRIDRDPNVQDNLIKELSEKPRAVTDEENALLLQRQVDLQNQYDQTAAEMNKAAAEDDRGTIAENRVRLAAVSDDLLKLYNIGKQVGTETGRGLNARKMMMREDFSLASLERQKRAANDGRPLTDEERSNLQKIADDFKAKNEALEQHIAKQNEQISDWKAKTALREIQSRVSPHIIQVAEKFVSKLEAEADKEREFLRRQGNVFAAGMDPRILKAFAKIGAAHIGRAGLDFAKWSDRMVKEFGDKIRPHLTEIYAESQKVIDSAGMVSSRIKNGGVAEPEDRLSNIAAKIRSKVADNEHADVSGLAQQLAREFVENGVTDRDKLIDAVHNVLRDVIPGHTRRDTMDAISGYGQYRQLSHDAVSAQLRDLKGQMQQVAKLEDMAMGEAPAKTGVERRTPSDEERRLIQQVEDAKKATGYTVTNPEKQLATALQSAKKRLQNQIADLESQITKREKIVKSPNRLEYDDEANTLKARRDALKKDFDEIFGTSKRAPMTDAQRLKAWKTRTEGRIAELEDKLAKGDFSKKGVRPPVGLDEEGLKLKAASNEVIQRFQRELMKDRLAKRPLGIKFADNFAKYVRFGMLSSPISLAKLSSAAIERIGFNIPEQAAGAVISKLLPKVAEKAPREGGVQLRAEIDSLTSAFTSGIADAWKTIKTGKSDLERLYGKQNAIPRTWMDFLGSVHGAIKSPVKRAEFTRSFTMRATKLAAAGVDVTDPLVQAQIGVDAYRDANRAIFMQDHRVVTAYKRGVAALEEPNKDGRISGGGKALATILKVIFPIVKIPMNIATETAVYTGGAVASGPVKLGIALYHGLENLHPDEADAILRHFKKGSLGLAGMTMGFFMPQSFGGYYQPGQKRDDKDVAPGNVRMFEVDLPTWLVHNPLLETMQIGATVHRVAYSKFKKGDIGTQGITTGAIAGLFGLVEETPYIRETLQLAKAFDPREMTAFFGEFAKSRLIPQLAQFAATRTDTDAKGNPIKRNPETFLQHVETGIPGLRETVPDDAKTLSKRGMTQKDFVERSRNAKLDTIITQIEQERKAGNDTTLLEAYLRQKTQNAFDRGTLTQAEADKVFPLIGLTNQNGNKAPDGKQTDLNEENPAPEQTHYKDADGFVDRIAAWMDGFESHPIDAWHKWWDLNETIRRTQDGTIVVERMDKDASQAEKKRQMGNNREMKLDHTIPLEIGGDNSRDNLKLVPTETWARFTPVENAVAKAWGDGKITNTQARDLITKFKTGVINEKDVNDAIGSKLAIPGAYAPSANQPIKIRPKPTTAPTAPVRARHPGLAQ